MLSFNSSSCEFFERASAIINFSFVSNSSIKEWEVKNLLFFLVACSHRAVPEAYRQIETCLIVHSSINRFNFESSNKLSVHPNLIEACKTNYFPDIYIRETPPNPAFPSIASWLMISRQKARTFRVSRGCKEKMETTAFESDKKGQKALRRF